jgi:hypothetical protein
LEYLLEKNIKRLFKSFNQIIIRVHRMPTDRIILRGMARNKKSPSKQL